MPIAESLEKFSANATQCDNLIANAHKTDANNTHFLSQLDREQVTVAAFLNLFIAWEQFIETSVMDYMMGEQTVTGQVPERYVRPPSRDHCVMLVVHMNRYFDFANHEAVKRLAKMYFKNGYPFDTPLSAIMAELAELKTIRNSCAHISSTTATALDSLAVRIFGQPKPKITVYDLLTSVDPRSADNATVYQTYREKLIAAASLITNG